MTPTTTDAAEARAREVLAQAFLDFRHPHPARHIAQGRELTADQPIYIAAMLSFATAEATSGAGEREADLDAAADAYAADYVMSTEGADYEPTEWERRLIVDALHGFLAECAASRPPATDPAMVERVAKALGLHRIPGGDSRANPPSRWPSSPQDTLSGRDGTVPLTWDFAEQCRADARVMFAALAAAPTIPATGEVVPAGMKPWGPGAPGYPEPPADYAIGPVVFRKGTSGREAQVSDPALIFRAHTGEALDITAYTPKATIPATGHAATEGEGA
ncbi:hypothetical protein QE361_001930 [Sphingomonas sp. SORGH_AS802]|uniref:hypothetical protein n=1 Tax=unclassified Sphingomonas TaxID=196159 RepID=UPI00285B14E1|nr:MULTISPECIES: hypothetical protein [unclassified Sphingomonas]MDR6126687.1 hypothetical protein [Sphingomonas sp. SORGH_AS_0438]MDR6134947.1 hypothetical protein [Sphingomonas sp. SORGH_AS_0802]